MSFAGKEVELLEPEKEDFYPDLSEPRPISPKHKGHKGTGVSRNSNILFSDNNGNIHMTFQEKTLKKPVIKRRPGPIIEEISILGTRKLAEAFGEGIYNDKERYGQDIPTDFFKTNIGHGVYTEIEIIDWCYKYLATKKNVRY